MNSSDEARQTQDARAEAVAKYNLLKRELQKEITSLSGNSRNITVGAVVSAFDNVALDQNKPPRECFGVGLYAIYVAYADRDRKQLVDVLQFIRTINEA